MKNSILSIGLISLIALSSCSIGEDQLKKLSKEEANNILNKYLTGELDKLEIFDPTGYANDFDLIKSLFDKSSGALFQDFSKCKFKSVTSFGYHYSDNYFTLGSSYDPEFGRYSKYNVTTDYHFYNNDILTYKEEYIDSDTNHVTRSYDSELVKLGPTTNDVWNIYAGKIKEYRDLYEGESPINHNYDFYKWDLELIHKIDFVVNSKLEKREYLIKSFAFKTDNNYVLILDGSKKDDVYYGDNNLVKKHYNDQLITVFDKSYNLVSSISLYEIHSNAEQDNIDYFENPVKMDEIELKEKIVEVTNYEYGETTQLEGEDEFLNNIPELSNQECSLKYKYKALSLDENGKITTDPANIRESGWMTGGILEDLYLDESTKGLAFDKSKFLFDATNEAYIITLDSLEFQEIHYDPEQQDLVNSTYKVESGDASALFSQMSKFINSTSAYYEDTEYRVCIVPEESTGFVLKFPANIKVTGSNLEYVTFEESHLFDD